MESNLSTQATVKKKKENVAGSGAEIKHLSNDLPREIYWDRDLDCQQGEKQRNILGCGRAGTISKQDTRGVREGKKRRLAININTVFHYHDKSFFIICDYVLWEGKKRGEADPKKLNGIDTTNGKMQREKKKQNDTAT